MIAESGGVFCLGEGSGRQGCGQEWKIGQWTNISVPGARPEAHSVLLARGLKSKGCVPWHLRRPLRRNSTNEFQGFRPFSNFSSRTLPTSSLPRLRASYDDTCRTSRIRSLGFHRRSESRCAHRRGHGLHLTDQVLLTRVGLAVRSRSVTMSRCGHFSQQRRTQLPQRRALHLADPFLRQPKLAPDLLQVSPSLARFR